MLISRYLIIQQVVMGFIFALGCQLVVESMPPELKGGRLHNFGRILGLAIMTIPIASFIYFFSSLRYAGTEPATALNLSAYCVALTFLSLAVYVLLGRTGDRVLLGIHCAVGLLYPLPLWLGLYSGSEFVAKHALIACYVFFVILVVIHVVICFYFYYCENDRSEVDESRLCDMQLSRLFRVMIASVVLASISVASPPFFHYPLWLGMVFVFTYMFCMVFIYLTYRNMRVLTIAGLLQSKAVAVEGDDDVEVESEVESESEDFCELEDLSPLSDEVMRSIDGYLQKWLTTKEYLDPQVTINTVVKVAYTNRTYLSKYINSVYKCSFRTWITQLRIEEAKHMLVDFPALSIDQIRQKVGFASVESFSHIFVRYEQVTPLRWREEHLE